MTAESSSKEKPSYSGYGYHGGGRKPTGLKRVSFCVSCQPEELQQIIDYDPEADKGACCRGREKCEPISS